MLSEVLFEVNLKYKDLEIQFEDGMISDYTCNNFESEAGKQKIY